MAQVSVENSAPLRDASGHFKKPKSRQQRYQLEHHAKGLCMLCDKKLYTAWLCKEHHVKDQIRGRARREKRLKRKLRGKARRDSSGHFIGFAAKRFKCSLCRQAGHYKSTCPKRGTGD